jgi:hypothetical protein
MRTKHLLTTLVINFGVYSSRISVDSSVFHSQCYIISHSLHMRALPGLTNIAFLVADELAFFSDNLQNDVRATIDRLAIKNSGMKAALISTPNKLGDIMDVIKRMPEEECPYKCLYLPYSRGLGKIFSVQEINELKNKIFGFEREYNLKFNVGYQGVF